MKKLTPQERIELELTLKVTKDVNERDRIRVILGIDNGHSIEDIVDILRIGERTIYKYFEDYQKEGKTINDPHEGKPCRLSEEQEVELKEHLRKITYRKSKEICHYVKRKYKVKYTVAGMTDWLKRNGFVYKAPVKIPGKVDLQKQEAFREEYEQLKEGLGEEEKILFMDAVHPEYQSQAVYGWILKGEEKTLRTTAKQERVHFLGAVELSEIKIVTKEYPTIGAVDVVKFLHELEENISAKTIHLICDNSKAHRNKAVYEYIKKSAKFKIHYLPPYSPNLNPIERLWKVLREQVTYNRVYFSFKEFRQAIRDFFNVRIGQLKGLLRRRINDHFQRMNINTLQTPI